MAKMCRELVQSVAQHMEKNIDYYGGLSLPLLYGSDQFKAEVEGIRLDYYDSVISSVDFSGNYNIFV